MENVTKKQPFNFLTVGAATLAAAMTFSATAPVTTIFADETVVTAPTSATGGSLADMVQQLYPDDDIQVDVNQTTPLAKTNNTAVDILATMSADKRAAFNELVQTYHYTSAQQLEILQYWEANDSQPRWKAWLVRKALELASKKAGKAASGAYLDLWVARINNVEKDVKTGIAKFLMGLGVPKGTAKNIAAAVAFVVG